MIQDNRIAVRSADGIWVVRAGGAVIGESGRALELEQGDGVAVIYFPREDLAMPFLEPSEARSLSPGIGEASFWNIVAKSGTIENAGWSFEAPAPEAARLAGHIAFSHERVTIERL